MIDLNGNGISDIWEWIYSACGINPNGELVDSWGTPFFFHQLSSMDLEIRSAGPDRIMWTTDDLVTK